MASELEVVLNEMLETWYSSIRDPKKSQLETLEKLVQGYAKTEYGKRYSKLGQKIENFESSFPITNYEILIPEIEKARTDYSVLFPEAISEWVMTRGTTGRSKVIPTTETFLSQIFACGARAITNFALKKDLAVMNSYVLNLNFPSEVVFLEAKKKYGYSSGTYAKLFPSLENAGLLPAQEEIDSVGGGITKKDWEERFDLVYERTKTANIGSVMGVTPVILSFARYVKRKYGIFPKEMWKIKGLFLTSVAKIHSRYGKVLQHYFGNAPVIEMYTATEGVFAQQFDEQPYVVPNYDTYFFEVKLRNGKMKPLTELGAKEWGSIVISSVLFPRYEIGDLVESVGNGYYRIFGRNNATTRLEHYLYNFVSI